MKIVTKLCLVAALAVASVMGASAQEVFVGGEFVRVNPNVRQTNFRFDRNTDSVGPAASVTVYAKNGVGATAEGAAVFNTGDQPAQLYTALGGLTYKYRKYPSVQPFIKGQAGLAFERVKGDPFPTVQLIRTDSAFATKVSAGVDLGKGPIKVRLFEFGYLTTNLYAQRRGNFTASAGVVF